MHHSLLLFQCPGWISKSSYSLVLSLTDCGRIRPGGTCVQCSCCQHDCRHSRGQQCLEPLAKEQVPPFNTMDRGFWFILTYSLNTHMQAHTHVHTRAHTNILSYPVGSLHYSTSPIKKLPINEVLTPYIFTEWPLSRSLALTQCPSMVKQQQVVSWTKANLSACKFDTMCHNPTHCSHLESCSCRHGNWASWWKLSTNEIPASL